jgi:hypothetical protein
MEVHLAIHIKDVTRPVVAAVIGVMLPAMSFANSLSDKVDELSNSIDDMESKVQSTLLSGGSNPVSFAGEARLKMQYHNLGFDSPRYMFADRSYLQSGWEGNENIYRLGMVASAGRNTVLWSKIGFQHVLTGNRYYEEKTWDKEDGSAPYQYRYDKVKNSITIHEDMSAGIAVRTVPASFWVRLGNTMWTEASPLTVWKAQPRTFAWEYLPFEVEQPIARYYEYNIAKGEKAGRAAWNKKPFNGINVESINLLADIYVNFVYGTFERFDNFEREYIDFAGDLGYADGADNPFPEKGHGIGDSYRHVIHGRLAKGKVLGDMTLGLNYVGIDYKDDVLFANKEGAGGGAGTGIYHLLTEFRGNDSIFVKEPKTLSLDLRGPITNKISIHADVGVNRMDTVWFVNPDTTRPGPTEHPEYYSEKSGSVSDIVPAFYTKLTYSGFLPTEVDLAYIGKGFYSPFSFATPMDAFYAFGSNMVGAGKFIARGEGSPYTQNMTGVNLTFSPKLPGYGHLRVKYGQHFNIEEGRDILYFPYRLNGSDQFSFLHSSFNRWGNGLVDNSLKANGRLYRGRLGDESFVHLSSYNTNGGGNGVLTVAGAGAGGLRSDYLAMFEGFVPYDDKLDAYNNLRVRGTSNDNNLTTIMNQTFTSYYVWNETGDGIVIDSTSRSTSAAWVPVSKKYTFNLEVDAAYDIGASIGYKKDLFVGGYAGINGVSKTATPLAFSDNADNMLLWSLYVRLEPAIALHKSLYLLGLFGYENWRSQKAWMLVDKEGGYINPTSRYRGDNVGRLTTGEFNALTPDNIVNVPIDYHDFAFGLGFDWDMLERVGLHGRAKWITHEDRGMNDYYTGLNRKRRAEGLAEFKGDPNDWATPVFSLEIKTWF